MFQTKKFQKFSKLFVYVKVIATTRALGGLDLESVAEGIIFGIIGISTMKHT